ncbi:MAG: hypothetical protein WCA07_08750 [Gloeobacterales cyanobacterium]
MVQIQGKLALQRDYIVQLLGQLTVDYQNTKAERRDIAECYPNSEEEFTFSEELELLTVSIRGYASQVRETETVKNCELAIAYLQQLRALDRPVIAQFYEEEQSRYTQIQSYLWRLDYLRLLVLEYLQMQQSVQPLSA